MLRRHFLKLASALLTSCYLFPKTVWAALWNQAAFETDKLAEALLHLGVKNPTQSQSIHITAPDRAENGAIVQIEVRSALPNTTSIAILVEKNPTPLIAQFNFIENIESFVVTRIKMAETSDLTVIVKAGDQFFVNTKNVIVLENGCG